MNQKSKYINYTYTESKICVFISANECLSLVAPIESGRSGVHRERLLQTEFAYWTSSAFTADEVIEMDKSVKTK